jgi:hypothetical protein
LLFDFGRGHSTLQIQWNYYAGDNAWPTFFTGFRSKAAQKLMAAKPATEGSAGANKV